jgi:hypothetical protein
LNMIRAETSNGQILFPKASQEVAKWLFTMQKSPRKSMHPRCDACIGDS